MANRLKTSDQAQRTAVPLGLGVAAMIGAGIAWEAMRSRRVVSHSTDEPGDRNAALVTYLREHLSGADLAIRTVDRLRHSHVSGEDRELFEYLHRELIADRHAASELLRSRHASPRSMKRLVSRASGTVLSLAAGGRRGDLSLFRALEALAIGVQGKRCMWTALKAIDPGLILSDGRSVSELESAAIRQWDAIENRRRALARETFPSSIRDHAPLATAQPAREAHLTRPRRVH
jgi:hypothetical protein